MREVNSAFSNSFINSIKSTGCVDKGLRHDLVMLQDVMPGMARARIKGCDNDRISEGPPRRTARSTWQDNW